MARYRTNLPQCSDNLFITDSGLETPLLFHEGMELPYFAAFDLLKNVLGYADLARKYEVGFILESATWRASHDWGAKLGYSTAELTDLNRKAIALLHDVRNECETDKTPMVISGCIGPRGDGYNPNELMDAAEAECYHSLQAEVFCEAEELDDGDPVALGDLYRDLRNKLKNLNTIGGCCGTDLRHVEEMCKAFLASL